MLVRAGEDEDLKRMMWVVENLQEELLTADEARMAADQQVQARSKVVQGLQVQPSPPYHDICQLQPVFIRCAILTGFVSVSLIKSAVNVECCFQISFWTLTPD